MRKGLFGRSGLVGLKPDDRILTAARPVVNEENRIIGYFSFYFLKWFSWREPTAARATSARPWRRSYSGTAGQDRRRIEERDAFFCFAR
jgi:hypothetical protein